MASAAPLPLWRTLRLCSVAHCSGNKAAALLIAPSHSTQYCCVKRQLLCNSTTTRYTHTSSNNPRSSKQNSSNKFLTSGFQPTAITGDNIGFYHGSTFYDGAPPNVLPILNASPILSPGKYVKQSSWTDSHHQNNNRKGTKSGTEAALRLVEARREFMCLMKGELLGPQHMSNDNNNRGQDEEIATDVRKIYVLTGHGVPSGLLSHLIQIVRGWTASPLSTQQSSVVQLSFQNVYNSTTLNRHEIQLLHANGTTTKVVDNNSDHIFNHGDEWEQDFELYMVVMDRIASRLASFVLLPHGHPNHHVDSPDKEAEEDLNDKATLGSSGSVITPASLKRWNVTMMKGEALPMSLLPSGRHERQQKSLILTAEWVIPKINKDCCNIILRLQDDGSSSTTGLEGESGRDPISLVFEGVYV